MKIFYVFCLEKKEFESWILILAALFLSSRFNFKRVEFPRPTAVLVSVLLAIFLAISVFLIIFPLIAVFTSVLWTNLFAISVLSTTFFRDIRLPNIFRDSRLPKYPVPSYAYPIFSENRCMKRTKSDIAIRQRILWAGFSKRVTWKDGLYQRYSRFAGCNRSLYFSLIYRRILSQIVVNLVYHLSFELALIITPTQSMYSPIPSK